MALDIVPGGLDQVLFDGRTVVVKAIFQSADDPLLLGNKVRQVASGPLKRMAIVINKFNKGLFEFTIMVNTDESEAEVSTRLAFMSPRPKSVVFESPAAKMNDMWDLVFNKKAEVEKAEPCTICGRVGHGAADHRGD